MVRALAFEDTRVPTDVVSRKSVCSIATCFAQRTLAHLHTHTRPCAMRLRSALASSVCTIRTVTLSSSLAYQTYIARQDVPYEEVIETCMPACVLVCPLACLHTCLLAAHHVRSHCVFAFPMAFEMKMTTMARTDDDRCLSVMNWER